jgi:hypothetical protein
MGIHDYSCYICSDEGEQCLMDWENGERHGMDHAYLFVTKFDDKDMGEMFSNSYSNNINGEFVECNYSWDNLDFDEYSGYCDTLMEDKYKYKSMWFCKNINRWIINFCPYCYNIFFVKDKIIHPSNKYLNNLINIDKHLPFTCIGGVNLNESIQNLLSNNITKLIDTKNPKWKHVIPQYEYHNSISFSNDTVRNTFINTSHWIGEQ